MVCCRKNERKQEMTKSISPKDHMTITVELQGKLAQKLEESYKEGNIPNLAYVAGGFIKELLGLDEEEGIRDLPRGSHPIEFVKNGNSYKIKIPLSYNAEKELESESSATITQLFARYADKIMRNGWEY